MIFFFKNNKERKHKHDTSEELNAFEDNLKAARELPSAVYDVIRAAKDGHPMDVLRTAVSALDALEPTSQRVDEKGFLENGT